MPRDPVRAATAVARLQNTQARYGEVQEERRQAILEAVRAEVSLREVADAANCSHESVRRIVAADGQVTLEMGGANYLLSGQQVEMLIYKLAGSAQGAFPKDIQLLDAGTAWLPAAADLANRLQEAMADEDGKPCRLDDAVGFALYQILRLTNFGGLTVLSQLHQALHVRYGNGAPHVITALQRG